MIASGNTPQQPLAKTNPKTGLPTYTLPGAPGPTDTSLTLTGTFADQQTAADTAYQNALAQLESQKSQYYSQEGFNTDGSVANNPLSAYGQLSNSMAQASNATDNSVLARGLGNGRNQHGVGAQLEEGTNQANAAQQQQFLSSFLSGADNIANQETGAAQTHTDASNAAKQGMIDYMIQNGQHINAAGQLTPAEVKQRVQSLAVAWMKKNGGGKNSKNQAGMTFQQYLTNHLGSKLYDPSAHYHIGKVSY